MLVFLSKVLHLDTETDEDGDRLYDFSDWSVFSQDMSSAEAVPE